MRSNILKALGVLGAGLACAVAGYQFAAALYGQDIAELREDYATRARELEEQYREKESLANAKVRAAWEERDIALARANDLSDDVARVRLEADAARRRLSAVTAGSCDAERKQLARCADLLGRGAGLVRRGVDLSERTAIDKDAMAMIVSQ